VAGSKSAERTIEGLDRRMPLMTAARRVLQVRLQSVSDMLPKARKATSEQPEPVHQLRVSTRRAEAALAAFRPCIKGARRKKVRDQIRSIRNAASIARMADVHLSIFRRRLDDSQDHDRIAIEYAVMRTQVARTTTQQEVADAVDKAAAKKLKKHTRRLLTSLRVPMDLQSLDLGVAAGLDPFRTVTLDDAAHMALPELAQKFRKAAAQDLETQEGLHGLRLRVKPLRYALEIFSCCLDQEMLESLYDQLSMLQERLGAINDALEIAQRLDDYLHEMSRVLAEGERPSQGLAAGLAKLIAEYRSNGAREHQEFLRWWQGPHALEFHLLLDQLFGASGGLGDEASAAVTRNGAAPPEIIIRPRGEPLFAEVARRNGEPASHEPAGTGDGV